MTRTVTVCRKMAADKLADMHQRVWNENVLESRKQTAKKFHEMLIKTINKDSVPDLLTLTFSLFHREIEE